MASEVANLPKSVLSAVVNFTGNTTVGSNIVSSVSSISGIEVDMVIQCNPSSPNSLANGSVVTFVSDTYIVLNYAATATNSNVSFFAGATSYTAEFIYNSVPQNLQDKDASNGYPLYKYIWDCSQMLDNQVNLLARSGIGANGIFDPNYVNADGWSQILDINRCPAFALPWLAQFVGVSILPTTTLTKAQQIDQIKNRSSFKRGLISTIVNALMTEINTTISGTQIVPNQIVVMEQTKPLTTTFYGNTHASTTIDGIPSTAGLSAGMYLFGSGVASNTTIVSVSTNSIVISAATTSSVNSVNISAVTKNKYSIDQYSLTILIPSHYFIQYTYGTLNQQITGNSVTTYLVLDTGINNLGSSGYGNLIISGVPTSNSQFAPFIYKYRPAGVQVYIGAY